MLVAPIRERERTEPLKFRFDQISTVSAGFAAQLMPVLSQPPANDHQDMRQSKSSADVLLTAVQHKNDATICR